MGGYAYYSGARFAIYGAGCSDALARGGRYDEVGAVFGRNRPAVGFSLDLKELAEVAPGRRRPHRDPRALGRGRRPARRPCGACAPPARPSSACCPATSTKGRNSTATASWSRSPANGRCARSTPRCAIAAFNRGIQTCMQAVIRRAGRNVVVVGTQWGDEGKGKVVDWLTDHAQGVVRFQGGHNAGHTLVIKGARRRCS
jgi:hypothetical protein